MQLTGLETALVGGAIATGASIVSIVGTKIADRKERKDFVHKNDFQSQVNLCGERRESDQCRVEQATNDINSLHKMFERFIIHSDLPADTKATIINGGSKKS